ncbi:MAG: hypothetical protein Kow0032_28240 [Methyloligellaceae bacterium]
MWLLRVLGVWCLLVAMVALTIDATRSLAGLGKLEMTSLGEHWFSLSSATLNMAQAAIQRNIHPYLWDPVIQSILQVPTWIFFTGLGLFLYWLGRRRRRRNVYMN